ncbi:photosynthetic complex putative assembly protein PuhB [Alsobacter sp. R-9]
MSAHDDFAVEPMPGLPAVPPQGETILWQGRPDRTAFSRHVFHLRLIGVYFAILAAWRVVTIASDGGTLADMAVSVAVLAACGVAAVGLFAWIARSIQRSTVYTITSRRVVMRFGVAFPMTFNLPYARIDGADLVQHGDGIGSIALRLAPGERVAYAVLWPHARPWRFGHPQPMLRCIPKAETVAAILGQAYAAAQPARVGRTEAASAATARPTLSPAA